MNSQNHLLKRIMLIFMVFILVIPMFPTKSFAKSAYDPNQDYKELELRFWEDQKPDIGFYINASSKYILETVTSPKMGSTFGEWSVMDLLRGMYTGYDYINHIPSDYFDKYLTGIEGYVIGKQGNLDRNKSTEWSRLMLTLSSLGYDITNVGKPGKYVKTYAVENTGIINARQINENNLVILDEESQIYTDGKKYMKIPSGTYTANESTNMITDKNGNAYKLNTSEFMTIDSGYNFIEKLSSSFKFSYRQGINGPIWETIAMNTGNYKFYEDTSNADNNTFGKMIGFILNKEITQTDGTVGGWALTGKVPDPDITAMALQGLAPYYLDRAKYEAEQVYYEDKNGKIEYSYEDFAKAVERALYVLSLIQKENGGYNSWGSINSESIVQVIVALTALEIDPLQENIELKHIGKTIDYVTEGKEHEGVFTNNMIDALLTFWANGSGSSPDIGGFKHVTAGNDGGGGSGTGVNAMATDQALYGLIAYDRFLKGENKLYDMTDMINGEYKEMSAKSYSVTYKDSEKNTSKQESYSPYEVITIPNSPTKSLDGKRFVNWNSKQDGSGATYKPGEKLSMPKKGITLYAQYEWTPYKISFITNGATFIGDKIPTSYTINDADIMLPTEEQMVYKGYNFRGWYDNAEFKGDAITTIPKGSMGDKQFFAKWLSDGQVVSEVEKMIANLPNVENLTLKDEENVKDVRKAYEALTPAQRSFVSNYDKLVALEARLIELKNAELDQIEAEKVIQIIGDLPEESIITLDNQGDVENARLAYNNLTSSQQKLVSNYPKLVVLEAKLEELKDEANQAADKAIADKVSEQIANLPDEADLTLDDRIKVENVRKAYANLTASQQKLVVNYEKLVTLEAKLEKLENDRLDQIAAEKVIQLIRNLPDEAVLTINDKVKIQEARDAYTSLTPSQRTLVTNYNKLLTLEAKLIKLMDQAAADAVTLIISRLPEVSDVSLENKTEVVNARKAYMNLTNTQRGLVSNYEKLVALEKKLEQLTNEEIANALDKAEAEKVTTIIKNLPEVSAITLTNKPEVEHARKAYNKLTLSQQKLVINYEKLVQLEKKLTVLINEGAGKVERPQKPQKPTTNGSNPKIPSNEPSQLTDDRKTHVQPVESATKPATLTTQEIKKAAESNSNTKDSSKETSQSKENTQVAVNNDNQQTKQVSQTSPASENLSNTVMSKFGVVLIALIVLVIGGGAIYYYLRRKSV